jgi:hypothetical protein
MQDILTNFSVVMKAQYDPSVLSAGDSNCI